MGELDNMNLQKSPLKKHVAQFHEDAGTASKKKKERANRNSASSSDLIHDWKQDSRTITVTIQIGPGIDSRTVDITVEEQYLSLVLLDGRKMQINLFASVVPVSKAVTFKVNRCIIKLNKQDCTVDWPSLEMPEKPFHDKSKLKLDNGITLTKGEVLKAEKEHLENEKDHSLFVPVLNPKTDMIEREGDSTMRAYLYVKQINKETLVVTFEDESFRVQFSTEDPSFLSQYENASKDTIFEWPVVVKGKLLKERCAFKLATTNLEIIMMKSDICTWGVLSRSDEIKGIKEDISKGKWLQVSSIGASSNSIIPPAPPPPPSFNGATKSSWLGTTSSRNSNASSLGYSSRLSRPENRLSNLAKGVTGLDNIGNTCFMNSVLQCLINTTELREYFLDDHYHVDLNKENPLGMGGSLAKAFASLMKLVWSGANRSMAPSELKRVMSMKANQFSGYAQHDSQEFMVELLDGLHEDLNRIRKKPYIAEQPDLEGWTDSEAAEVSWKLNKSRNDSIIDDLFKGQFKSTLQCHTCKKKSLKFDEFCCLSVPIPKDLKVIAVIFYWRDTSKKPLRIVSKVSADANADELLQQLSQKTGVRPRCIKIIEATDSKINKIFERRSNLGSVSMNDKILAFEVLPPVEGNESILELAVTQRKIIPPLPDVCSHCCRKLIGAKKRCKSCYRVCYCDAKCQSSHADSHRISCKLVPEYVGSPFIISIPESEATYTNLSRMMESYARFSVDIFQPPVSQSKKHRSNNSDGEMSSETEDMDVDSDEEMTPLWSEKPKNRPFFNNYSHNAEADWKNRGATASRPRGSLSSNSSDDEEPPQLSPILRRSPAHHQRTVNCAKTLFAIRPVISRGGTGGEPLLDRGSELIDLSDFLYLYMDWHTSENMPVHCFVQNRDMECEGGNHNEEYIARDKQTSIEACIDLFTRPENLSEDDSWICPRCKKPVEATKQMSLWRLPPILIVQLKRFSFKHVIYSNKIDKFVKYPVRGLNLRPFMSDQSQDITANYDLYGVINHMGRLLGGHYTAYCRTVNPQDTTQSEIDWRLCDDSSVYKLDESRVVHEQAYLLLYRRRDCPFVINRPVRSPPPPVDENSDSDVDDLREPGGDGSDDYIGNLRTAISNSDDAQETASETLD